MGNISQINGLLITAESASFAATASLVVGTVATASFAVTASYALSSAGGPGGDTTAVEAQVWFLL